MGNNQEIQIRDNRERGWFWIHNIILDEYCLEPYDLAVYVALARYANSDGKCWPSLATLAEKTNMSEPRVIAAVKTLEIKKLLIVTRVKKEDGSNCANIYYLLQPESQGVVNVINQGGKHGLPGVVNDVNTINTYIKKDIKKDIALQDATRSENQTTVIPPKDEVTNPTPSSLVNPDWDTLAAVIDANKPAEAVITKPIQPADCPLPNTCDRGETCTPETCVMPRIDITPAVIELRATDTTTSEFVRDMRAVSSKPTHKGKRQQKEAPVILPEDIQELGRALVKSYWPMVARFGELSSPSRKQVIKVAWELKRMNIAPTDVVWFFDEWVTKRTWTEPYSLNVIVTWIQRALQQRALKKAQVSTSTVFVSPEDETRFEPMSLD